MYDGIVAEGDRAFEDRRGGVEGALLGDDGALEPEHLEAIGVDGQGPLERGFGAGEVAGLAEEEAFQIVALDPTRHQFLGAAHAFEIPFVFGHFRLGPADPYMFTDGNLPGRKELSDAMMSYWARFIRTGDPGRGVKDDQEPWEAYGANERLMILDTRADGGRRMIDRPLTRELILEAIAADQRLNEGDRRCRVYRRMADKNRLIGPGDLPGLGCQSE